MATPHDLYIRFLLTKGIDDLKDLRSEFEELNLQEPTQDMLDKQYDVIERALPKAVLHQVETRKYEGDFLKWMGILEVKDLWKKEKEYLDVEFKRRATLVFGIHDDPHLRLCINALLIKNCSCKDIADTLSVRFSALLREEHIELYKKYFFDPRRMTRKDWRHYLKNKTGKELHIYFTALSDTIEVLKTELELPTNVSVTEPLQFLLMKSYQKAKQYLEQSTKESNAEARAWISQVTNLVDKYEKYRSADKTDFAKQLQMEFEFVDHEFLTPESLQIKNDI